MTANRELINIKDNRTGEWEETFFSGNCITPFVDIYETDDDYVMTVGLPGVRRDNVKVKMENDSLMIFGKVDYEEIINRKFVLNETEKGNFFRKFNVSDSIDKSKIEAKYENGQLTLMLPKKDNVKPRNIDIM